MGIGDPVAGPQALDPRADGLLPDPYIAMGQTAENVATSRGMDRLRMDEWGVRSQNRAEAAIASGFFEREITPVTLADGTVHTADAVIVTAPIDGTREFLAGPKALPREPLWDVRLEHRTHMRTDDRKRLKNIYSPLINDLERVEDGPRQENYV